MSVQFRNGGKWKICLKHSPMGHPRALALFSSQGSFFPCTWCLFCFTHVTFLSASRLNLLHSGSGIRTTHHLMISLISLSIRTLEAANSALWTNYLKIRGKPGWLQDHSKTNTYIKKTNPEKFFHQVQKGLTKRQGLFQYFWQKFVVFMDKEKAHFKHAIPVILISTKYKLEELLSREEIKIVQQLILVLA